MEFFPQLTTGAGSQYPFVRLWRSRTIRCASRDGHEYKLGDPNAVEVAWEISLAGLNDSEWSAIESLFHASEGRLKSFTFLDPAGNLLSHSEDLTASQWQKDPLVQLTTGGIADPFGQTRAVRVVNTGQTTQGILQEMEIPANYFYCFSLFARSAQPAAVTLVRRSGGVSVETGAAVTANWSRFVSSGNLNAAATGMQFGFLLPPGTSVEIFGLQAEAQPGVSDYKPTTAQGGVYSHARFDQDALMLTTESPGQHATTIRIISTLQDE